MGGVNWWWFFTVMLPVLFGAILIADIVVTFIFIGCCRLVDHIHHWVNERFHHTQNP